MAGTNGQLKGFVERLERLAEEKQDVADQIKEVNAEIKGAGYDMAALRVVLKHRANPDAESEKQAHVEMYLAELGMG